MLPDHGSYPTAFAQIAGSDEAMRQNSVWLIYFLIQVLNVLTWICFALLQFLLDPQIIFDMNAPGGGLVTMLNNIWQLSRDLVNLFFALALVGISIYTVVTANKEMIHQHAAKFVLAVVLVNFSWFLPRIVIDIANITASTIYGIPSLMLANPGNPNGECKTLNACPGPLVVPPAGCEFTGTFGQCLCKCKRIVDIVFFPIIDNALPPRPNSTAAWEGMGYNCQLRLVCYREDELNMNTIAGHSAILNGLVVNYARLGALVRPPPVAAGRDALVGVLVRGAIILLIQTGLTFPLLAMVVSFLIRIPVLWLTISFMPFYFLGWFLDERITQGVPKMILELFLKAAFMPAVVAAPLAIGFILINAALAQDFTAAGSVGGLLNITAPIIDGVSNLWQILWMLMSIMVLYSGVFKALQGVQLGEQHGRMIQRIQDTGRQVRQAAVSGAMQIPIPGTTGMGPGGRGLSASGIADQIRGLNPLRPPGGGPTPPPAPLTGTMQTQANTASANAAANAAQAERLRKAVGDMRTGGETARKEVRDALHQLNPAINAATLTNEQLAQVLQHMQSGAGNLNRTNLNLTPETIAAIRGTPPTPPR